MKPKTKQLAALILAIVCTTESGGVACASDSNADLFRLLTYFGHAVYLHESGQYKSALTRLNSLMSELDKSNSKLLTPTEPLPLLHSDIKCGGGLRRLRIDALELRSQCRARLHQNESALSDLTQALALCSDNAYVRTRLSTLHLRHKKNSKDAIVELDRAIRAKDDLDEIYFVRAKLNQTLGKYKDAQRDIVKARYLLSEQQKKLDTASKQIEALLLQNKTGEALVLDEQLVRAFPRDVFVLSGYAERLSDSGHESVALNYASCAISVDPLCAYAYRVRAGIYAKLGKTDSEWSDANYAFNLEPRSVETLNTRAIANLDMDRAAQAIRDFNVLLKLRPDFANGFVHRSAAHQRLGNFDQAIKDSRMALSIDPTNAYAYQTLGSALRRSGLLSQARENLESSFRFTSTDDAVAMAKLNLAVVLNEVHDKGSIETLDSALALAPKLPRILLQRGACNAFIGEPDIGLKILLKPPPRAGTSKVTRLAHKTGTSIARKAQRTNILKAVSRQGFAYQLCRSDLTDCEFVTTRIIQKSPQLAEPHFIRGVARLCLGNLTEAAADLTRFAGLSKQRNRDVECAHHCLVFIESAKDDVAATALIRKVKDTSPTSVEIPIVAALEERLSNIRKASKRTSQDSSLKTPQYP